MDQLVRRNLGRSKRGRGLRGQRGKRVRKRKLVVEKEKTAMKLKIKVFKG
jgi:hypothetical protein